jgi:hypothetical protein
MALEAVPAGQASDGRALVAFVPTIASTGAPVLAEMNAVTTKLLTYSLVPDGFRHETTENVISDGRYTLKQVLELPGTITDTLEVQYVADTPAQTTLTPGIIGYIVHRVGVPNETAFAAGQKVDVIPIRAGIQRKVAPTANTLLQRVQKLFVTGEVQRDVAIAA